MTHLLKNTFKGSTVAIALLGLLTQTACFKVSQMPNAPTGTSASTGGGSGEPSKKNYAIISPEAMESILVNVLGVPVTDVSVQKIRDNALALGQADPANGIPGNSAMTALKAKIVLEAMIDGCTLGLQNAQVSQKLFPNGLNNYDTLFKTFTGRAATPEEVQLLDTLKNSVSQTVAPAAVCGAVIASIEPLNRS